ncbi:unnamed protein product [Trichogramma brassicae]|uniref:IQ motif and ubiquitin-like domain-containing protein n=1 Tax=Trichogramma brassicae TaxID=86971 RepID=A0A6H5I7J7_9HYME|nr:unnamed protein product [Trichogramma brassicae]
MQRRLLRTEHPRSSARRQALRDFRADASSHGSGWKSSADSALLSGLQSSQIDQGERENLQTTARGMRQIGAGKIRVSQVRVDMSKFFSSMRRFFGNPKTVHRKRDEADCRALNSPRNLADIDALLHHLETRPPSLPGCLSPRQRGLELLKIRQQTYKEIDEKMRAVRDARAKAARERFLAVNCRPKRWTDCKGRRIEMTTLRNQAALELWQLYRWLEAGESKGRLELLVKARSCIDGHECRSADKLRGLLDQEIFLLSKDVSEEKLDFLRKRILGSFLQFVRTVHNCRCRRVASRHEFREPLQRNRIFCLSCKKFRPACDFPTATRMRETLRCKACVRLRVNTRATVDLKPFAYILERIREDEESRGSLADAMSALDVRHLVLNIWHGHSVLSECDDPRELRLPRYEASKPWSPWNCVLLTEQETEAHYCMAASGCLAHYAEHLQRKISLAHTTAKIDFSVAWKAAARLYIYTAQRRG